MTDFPCPCCGSRAIVQTFERFPAGFFAWRKCAECGINGRADAWNKRAPPRDDQLCHIEVGGFLLCRNESSTLARCVADDFLIAVNCPTCLELIAARDRADPEE